MKIRKILSSVLAAVLCMTAFAGCSGNGTSSGSGNSSEASTESSVETAPESSESSTESKEEIPAPETLNVVALKGPTAMGLTKLMDTNETEKYGYEFQIVATPDEVTAMVANGSVDIACVPANLGSVLYNKTEGKVQAMGINTLGVLYICENGDTVKSINDLKGKTIYSSGKGATPEYSLNFILEKSGLANDVTVEWKSEHTECVSALLANPNSVALLPQPFVTTAQMKNEGIRVALDLNEEWDNLGVSSSLLTGIVIVRKEIAEQYPEPLNQFLDRYKTSVDFVNTNVDEGAKLVGKYDIVPEAVAKKAIPECNIVCITGAEMKTKLSGYLGVLFDSNPKSVGGTLPDDDFYFGA
ncbi:MAG: ABC transporter substrate-binding protein [Oscillospiraceae bacterium]